MKFLQSRIEKGVRHHTCRRPFRIHQYEYSSWALTSDTYVCYTLQKYDFVSHMSYRGTSNLYKTIP